MTRHLFLSLLAALTLVAAPQAKADAVESSTADSPKWYRVYTPNRGNYMLTSCGIGAKMKGTTPSKPYSASVLWRFEKSSAGTYDIICMDGSYIDPSSLESINSLNKSFVTTSTAPSSKWTITAASGKTNLYTVTCGTTQLHQGEAGSSYYVINWGSGSNASDDGCLFRFEEQDLTELQTAQAKALALLNTTTSAGTNPGQFPTAARTTFSSAISSATSAADIETAQATYLATMNQVEAGKSYFLKSSPSKSYCEGKYVYSTGSASQPMWGDKLVNGTFAWTFEDAGGGQFYIKNFATGEYIEPNSSEMTGATTTSATAKTKYTVTSLGSGAFNIKPDGKYPLHAQQVNSVLVMWEGGLYTASAWQLETISDDDLATTASVKSVTASPGIQTFAPGNTDDVLLKFATEVEGFTGNVAVNGVTIDFGSATTNAAADIETIKLYASENDDFVSSGNRKATLVGTCTAISGTTATITPTSTLTLTTGTNTFYVTADIKDDATVGDSIDAAIQSITYNDDQTFTVTSGNPEGIARIYNVASMPFQPYDLGSHYWRIPAMIVLHNQTGANASKNGRIVTMADNRFAHNGDLPNHIDVYERHSDDQGKTWTDHKLVAGSTADHALVNVAGNGFGDAALVETSKGKLIAIMVAGQYYFSSTPSNPNIPFIVTSEDGGDTWSTPRSLYDELYKGSYTQGTVQGSFAGSGRGLVLKRQSDESRNGRIMFAMSHRFTSTSIQEYIIYSDDEGETWNMSPNSAYSGGDESKLVELADGTVMISVRQSGNRGFNTSTDGGMTWGTQSTNSGINGVACNADILYFNKHILLHSYINNGSSRKNLTVAASLDNGKTWTNKTVICAPSAGYSTMDITADGKVALLYEDAACSSGYVMNYVSFPISWIVEGDPSKTAFDNALATAKTLVAAGGYSDVSSAKAGQYSKASIDALAALIPSDSEIEALSDYDELTDQLTAATEAVYASRVIFDGCSNTTAFTISSYETINSTSSYTIGSDATTSATNTTEWLVQPIDETTCSIKLADEDKYLQRSNNSAAMSTSPYAWTITKGDGEYWYLKSATTWMVINTTSGALNFWSNTSGSTLWSTKWVFKAQRETDAIGQVTTTSATKQNAIYDLNGRRLKTIPAKGVYITADGHKYVK